MQDLSGFSSGADYDARYGDRYGPEVSYLKGLASRQNGPGLDLCCGTGIVTVPLAKTGLDVVGVDVSEAMLKRAKAKAGAKENLSFYLQNALDFRTDDRFGLVVMTGNAFQAFTTESQITSLLTNVHKHLKPGGVFIFDTRLPEGYNFSLDENFQLWDEYVGASGRVRHFGKQARFDAEQGVLYLEMKRLYPDGSEGFSSIDLKFTPFTTLLTMLRENGFEVVNTYKNWEPEPFEAGGADVVLELVGW